MIFHTVLYFVAKYFKVDINHHCSLRMQFAVTVAACVSQYKKGSILEFIAKHQKSSKNLD